MRTILGSAFVLGVLITGQGAAFAQSAAPAPSTSQSAFTSRSSTGLGATVVADAGFTIGPDDVLGVLFWRDPEMSGDVTVRPDGMITLPLLRDVKAAGLTPTQLADRIQEAAREYVTDASVTVVVRQLNSRRVFITGEVAHPGAYALGSSMTVMQLIAVAGGLTEFANAPTISVMRVEDGQTRSFTFDYREVARGKKPQQNMLLKPGDTVVVPER